MTLVQKEVKKVYIWKEPYTDYSAMRGPCPEGFHVGSSTEWENIKTIWTTLGGSATSGYEFADALKMPRAGYRSQSTGNVASQGTNGYYRLSEEGSTNELALSVNLTRYILNCSSANSRSEGYPIRPVKDSPVIANDSWTRLYGSSLSSGIYWNENLGLISLTKDGTNWITISDKNIGASNVGDRGYYYQWGNNYGFPTSGSVTTSSSQVNAGSYGPGNYYSSNTFITRSSSPYGRDSSNNGDLRGGETGTTQGGGDILVRENVEPVSQTFSYIGADQTWTVPYTQDYIITCKGAGSRSAAGGFAQGTFTLTAGDTLKIMVGQTGNSGNSATYGFGGSANGGSNAAGGGLSGVFTGSAAIAATDSSRALIIGGGAGGSSAGTGGQGGGTTGGTGTGSYGTAGAGGTQTGRGSGGNAGANQFNGGSGSRTYGYGGGGGWRGGNGSIGDGSGDDDKGGGGGSGYVKSTATNVTLTTGGGSAAGYPGSVTIVSVGNESSTPVTPGGCFLKGTTILMKEGCKNIEDIVEGDVVLSFNEEKGEIKYNNVVNFIKHPYNGKIIKLNGGLIEATYNHPVYTSKDKENRDYKFIGDIVEGDWLYTKDGYVQVVEKEERDYSGDVYNFTVDNNHNYFVGDGILVHNATTGSGI